MRRVAEPLRALGAFVDGRDDGSHPPLVVRGGALTGRRIELAVPSGQVHSALVLAGLQASGTTEIVEPAPSRDHTARLLAALGAPVEAPGPTTLRVRAGAPRPFEFSVPGDPSSAAFFVVAATITAGSELEVLDVSLNPGRIAYLDVLRAMGADVEVHQTGEELGEPVGDLRVRSADLSATTIRSSEAIVDELPLLALAGAFASGTTEIVDAAELRVKESDRIATVEEELARMGARVEAQPDGLVIHGDRGALHAASFESHGDHRIAMAAAVAANALPGHSTVHGWGSVAISYPGFATDLDRLTRRG
jgi:3-phosphoshikimate 1-carboxyvinyltransferase